MLLFREKRADSEGVANKKKQQKRQEKARLRADEITAHRDALRAKRTGTTKEALDAARLAYAASRRSHYGIRESSQHESN